MKTTVSTKGQIVFPAAMRQRDGIKPGQQFEIERIDRGEYRLVRCEPLPNAGLVEWLRTNERDLVVDPIIVGEIRFGIYLLAAGRRRRRLEQSFEDGVTRLHCLAWELATGLRWARLLADLRAAGQSMPIKDSLIAATALAHGLTVATRNTRDFRKARVKVVDPFA